MNRTQERYIDFINQLTSLTKDEKLTWKRIDYSDVDFKTDFGFNKRLLGRDPKSLCYWNSFYLDYKGSFIVLFSLRLSHGSPRLRITPYYHESKFKAIDFDPNAYTVELERLENMVLSKFPTPEDIIDEILSMY